MVLMPGPRPPVPNLFPPFSEPSQRLATPQQEKLGDATTSALSTSAAQVVTVAQSVDEGFILLDDQLLLEQPSVMKKAQVHELRHLLPE
ncbi:unnamed protein product, partial [Cuscuta campestris]